MKKNNKIIILILLLAVAVAAYLYFNQGKTTYNVEGAKMDFAVEDTSSITKIFIVDNQGKHVTLVKGEKSWLVNNKHDARPDNIRLLMKTFSRIAVKAPVPKSAQDNIIKSIATKGTKVEVYQGGGQPSKVYYIGNSTMDQTGTYMLLETEGVKSSVPFIMHIPGFRGFLNSRFFTDNQQWRDAAIFKYQPQDIQKLEVTYYDTPEQSFTITKKDTSFIMTDKNNQEVKAPANRILEYLERYEKIYYEMVDTESKPELIDSVLSSQPFIRIAVTDVDGEINEVIAYHMPNFRETLDPVTGELFEYDVDRMYANINKELFVYIQFATFDEITIKKDDFLIKN
ncbi:MAG: DUF4340 domain-containing protein [Flavobacteriales bacterium]|nr:DUF4340 domain-containing protein [Flavobacteriales bacterium]MCW8913918.1 DUF4340 domain-containing protein [Flavobacteriales bacterium]MCW8937282.1 DUF4340 domain-containing protein [Flavobacteriales bacterium]MCW8940900.1 DUF4340 domain-containing protein [Flavobacteriales bacterium]MCW8967202.1 DUF4340 domain-containing protein [Flavobacteriales bacterium]